MARSKRENLLIIGISAAVAIFLLDRYVVTPYNAARESIAKDHEIALDKRKQMRSLFQTERQLKRIWPDITASGLQAGASDVELQMFQALQGWAQQSGLANVSLRPERMNTQHGFVNVTVHVRGSGPTSAMAKLLWCIESAAMPVRVEAIQLAPVKGDGVDELQMQLTVSRLCTVPPIQKASNEAPDKVAFAGAAKRRRP
jgi:hypothetical protein